MRWESLFADLEAQAEEAERSELDAEVRDRSRAERGRVRTVDRLRASAGRVLDVRLRGGDRERGRLMRVGSDWFLLEPEPGRETLVPLAAVTVVGGLGRGAVEPGSEGLVAARLELRSVLRAVARDRSRVRLALDGGALSGVLRHVGADHLEISEDVRDPEGDLVPYAALLAVRRVEDVPG